MNAADTDPETLTCGNSRCGRAYDPTEGEDEIFCSQECRREDAAEFGQQTTAEPFSGLPDVEDVAAAVHEAWCSHLYEQGVTSRLDADGREQMIPYGNLTEAQKEKDRATVRAVYAAIEAAS